MPKREIVQTVILGRGTKTVEVDGKKVQRAKERIVLHPGQVFDFTDEELKQIMASNPNAVSTKTTVDLSASEDVDLKKVETTLNPNETGAPDASGTASTGDL